MTARLEGTAMQNKRYHGKALTEGFVRIEPCLCLIVQFLNVRIDGLRPAREQIPQVIDSNDFAVQFLNQTLPHG